MIKRSRNVIYWRPCIDDLQVRPIYHTVWHLFVMLGAALHWFDIYLFIIRTDLGFQATTNLNEAAAIASNNFMETVGTIRDML